jgi:diguanylate cyclase (GGDEF)-like protein
MSDAVTERTVILSNAPAGRSDRLFAFAVVAVSGAVFLLLAPLAKWPLGPLPAFIPIYQSALVINDVITVVFLLGQRRFSRSNGLGVLAGGYLFTALMSIVHALTFPGLFAPGGLLGAGPQTTAWLYIFWHSGFPLFVIAYACRAADERLTRRGGVALAIDMVSVCLLAGGFALITTKGQWLLPPVLQGNHYTPTLNIAVSAALLLNFGALASLARRRPYSVLDLWLMVTMCAWLFDIGLSAGLNAGRFDLGFYAGRIYGLLAASLILIVLLVQNGRLYVALVGLRESDRAKADELRRLSTIDPLTGIYNRRAFEDALDQEWRRMMRHQGALSLLMIDVDYFKRFNDSYGHVAGDECLRMVAGVLAHKTRRAGEMAARYGGEEFAVLLPQAGLAEAEKVATLLCAAVRERKIPHKGSEVAPHVTISIGVASISDLPKLAATLSRQGNLPSQTLPGATMLVEMADHALYRAKIAGRNRVNATCRDDVDAASALLTPDVRAPAA